MIDMARLLFIPALAAMLTGCAATLPTYEPMEAREAWRVVAERIEAIESVRAEADATLSGPDASSLRVDAVLLLRAPNGTRLRAWKLGHAVLDLTATGEGVWFDSASPPDGTDETTFGVGPDELAEGLALLGGWRYEANVPTRAERVGDCYEFDCPTESGTVRCVVDGSALVPLSLSRAGPDVTEFSLELDRYRLVGDTPWPQRARLEAGDRSILLVFRDVTLNEPLPAGAFAPPSTAERIR